MTSRLTLVSFVCIALFAWGGVLLFTRLVPPDNVLAFIGLFLLLSLALICTLTPIAYGIGIRFIASRLYRATLRHALRQSILLSLVIILNLILRALHSWNFFMGIVILMVAIIIEILSLARK